MRSHKELRKYQWRTIWFAIEKKCAALFLDMGLGKTIILLTVIAALKKQGLLTRAVIVVAPLRVVYMVWRQEGAEWQHTQGLTFSLVHGNLSKRVEALGVPADIMLMTPAGLVWLLRDYIPAMRRLLQAQGKRIKWPWQMLALDESTLYKSSATVRFRELKKVLHRFEYRFILTGTPRPQSALDLWSQMFIVDMGQRLGTRFSRYRRRFFERVTEYRYEPRIGSDRRISHAVKDVSIRLDADDWLDLPEIIIDPIKIKLPKPLMDQYVELEKELYLRLKRGEVNAANAAVMSGKCQQFANGAVYIDDPDTGERIGWELVHDYKMDALATAAQHGGDNLLVSYKYRHDLERLRTAHREALMLPSNMKKAMLVENDWNDGKIPMMLVHSKSASHGLNLQRGGHSVFFFSLTWSYEDYIQTVYRLRRSGQTSGRVLVHTPIVLGTTDELMMQMLNTRARGQREFLNVLRNYLKERYG